MTAAVKRCPEHDASYLAGERCQLCALEAPAPPRPCGFTVHGWRTNREEEGGETHHTVYENMVAGHVWGMLLRGCSQIIVERTGPDGRIAYQEGET